MSLTLARRMSAVAAIINVAIVAFAQEAGRLVNTVSMQWTNVVTAHAFVDTCESDGCAALCLRSIECTLTLAAVRSQLIARRTGALALVGAGTQTELLAAAVCSATRVLCCKFQQCVDYHCSATRTLASRSLLQIVNGEVVGASVPFAQLVFLWRRAQARSHEAERLAPSVRQWTGQRIVLLNAAVTFCTMRSLL